MSKFKIGQYYDQSLKEMSEKDISDNLESIAYAVEEKSYTKNLSEEEIVEKKDEFAEISLVLDQAEREKKDFLDNLKLKIKQPAEKSKLLLDEIRYKSEQTYGKLHLIDDQEEGMMYSFDRKGMCVDARPLLKNEKQLRMKHVINE